MAPKEKAIQLVELYWKSEHQPFNYEHSKRCALIAVDEILLLEQKHILDKYIELGIVSYYQEVKQEIEKL